VPDPEHPAAKAGRYVRGFGLAVQRELEKRSAPAERPPAPAEPAPPPPIATHDAQGRIVFVLFVLSLVALVLAVLRVDELFGGDKTLFRLAAALVMLGEAYLLLSNALQTKDRLAQRYVSRMWGRRSPVSRWERALGRVLRDGLTLLGIVFLAAGAFELLGATVGF
jgi:hypothetical protein